MKAAPLQALRAVFAGIGRLLLAADRARSQGREPGRGGRGPGDPGRGDRRPGEPARAARPARQRATAADEAAASAAAAAEEARRRSLDHSGNVRLLTAEDLADGDTDAGLDAAVAEAADPGPGAAEPGHRSAPADADVPADVDVLGDIAAPGAAEVAVPSPASEAPAGIPVPRPAAPVAGRLPLANYDALSLPSLRARLRSLDTAQLRVLLDYEMAHAGREAVITMFLRRIVKLDSGQG